MQWGPRYCPNCGENWRFTLAVLHILQTDFCVETVSSSRTFCVKWSQKYNETQTCKQEYASVGKVLLNEQQSMKSNKPLFRILFVCNMLDFSASPLNFFWGDALTFVMLRMPTFKFFESCVETNKLTDQPTYLFLDASLPKHKKATMAQNKHCSLFISILTRMKICQSRRNIQAFSRGYFTPIFRP